MNGIKNNIAQKILLLLYVCSVFRIRTKINLG